MSHTLPNDLVRRVLDEVSEHSINVGLELENIPWWGKIF